MPPSKRKRVTRSRAEASPLREVLAANLIAAREAQDISQWALARATGISQTYLSRIENAQTNTSLDLIDVMARELGLTAAALITPRRKKTG